MPQSSINFSQIIRDSIISILSNDDYFSKLLEDNSNVVIYKKPLTLQTIVKYPALSVYYATDADYDDKGFSVGVFDRFYIDCASQNQKLEEAIDISKNIADSVRITLHQFPNIELPQVVNRFYFKNIRPEHPIIDKSRLWTYISTLEIIVEYEEGKFPD